jgi:hypothetical protein
MVCNYPISRLKATLDIGNNKKISFLDHTKLLMVLCLKSFWPLQVFIKVLSLGGYLLNFPIKVIPTQYFPAKEVGLFVTDWGIKSTKAES